MINVLGRWLAPVSPNGNGVRHSELRGRLSIRRHFSKYEEKF